MIRKARNHLRKIKRYSLHSAEPEGYKSTLLTATSKNKSRRGRVILQGGYLIAAAEELGGVHPATS